MFSLPFDTYPLLKPFIFTLDPEFAHNLALNCLKNRLIPPPRMRIDPCLKSAFCGLTLNHPIGMAAGFDKQAEIINELFELGFSSIEVGGVTPHPQPGNPKPRMWRIAKAEALINRFNFNSIGFEKFLRHMEVWYDETPHEKRGTVGVNISRGDNCPDDAQAYIDGLKKFAPFVSFVTINVSCPNEACSRELEEKDKLKALLDRLKEAHETLIKKPLLLVKISADQTEQQSQTIAEVVLESGIDGMIVSNTSAMRPASLDSPHAKEAGGLSGKPIFDLSTKLLGTMYQLTGGKVPLIGCGGVSTGEDAYKKIREGASLVQLLTSMVFRGPFVVKHITEELAALLKRDGYESVTAAVGANYKKA
ncbi:MAG: quinone-dependent dihydroorotate dehydrogenase [Alphaproteobacteria bacterium]|nr:quinone-dependent dihydroorotate dehydrogenase [Alphaproteobacteria bacterium]